MSRRPASSPSSNERKAPETNRDKPTISSSGEPRPKSKLPKFVVLAVLLCILVIVHTSTDLQILESKKEVPGGTVVVREEKDKLPKPSVSSFTYNSNHWNSNGAKRIVILAGPHKTASTTLQDFGVHLAGQSVPLDTAIPLDPNVYHAKNGTPKLSHPSIENWVWPVPLLEDLDENEIRKSSPEKAFAAVASFVSGRRTKMFFKGNQDRRVIRKFYRSIFRRVWDIEQKNLLIGAEAFDSVVRHLSLAEPEDIHIDPDSGAIVDELLKLFSWNEGNSPLPTLEDIEVHLNFRTPRINHLLSIWHQLGRKTNLSKFLLKTNGLYQINSLGAALQFARKGVKTTIVDMVGVKEHEDQQGPMEEGVIGGLRGVIACDILQLKNLCDSEGLLHLSPPLENTNDRNKKGDRGERDLSEESLAEIGKALDEYDCSVWKDLQKYKDDGTLRILYPSRSLFQGCSEGSSVSFAETIDRIHQIVRSAAMVAQESSSSSD